MRFFETIEFDVLRKNWILLIQNSQKRKLMNRVHNPTPPLTLKSLKSAISVYSADTLTSDQHSVVCTSQCQNDEDHDSRSFFKRPAVCLVPKIASFIDGSMLRPYVVWCARVQQQRDDCRALAAIFRSQQTGKKLFDDPMLVFYSARSHMADDATTTHNTDVEL